jgi:hypothetical protein
MVQAGRSRVTFQVRLLDFSFVLILPAALWPMGSTQTLTEINTRNLLGGKVRPARDADNLTAIFQRIEASILQASKTTYRDNFTFTL